MKKILLATVATAILLAGNLSAQNWGKSKGLICTKEANGTAIAVSTTSASLMEPCWVFSRAAKDGDHIRLVANASYTINGTPDITFTVVMGTTVILTSGAVTTAAASDVQLIADITFRTVGTTSTIMASLITHSDDANLNTIDVNSAVNNWAWGEDVPLAFHVTWATSHADNSITGVIQYMQFLAH